ncbi:endonuclease [Pseudooceanicola lipolyticus]|uniref:Endonuclease n=1 Tax=Pseudooceanicola lipolyticus TaxID=2029104 RepID=A0A2M8J0Q6_9RHOB|nr:endonuclease/exonuclease/phosphatase family protein [Pseudooceanicola lipolyticus]PJE36355.1 endonuclease [Pseudooceanicola lipolyticus]
MSPARLAALLLACLIPCLSAADTLRVASFNAELQRDGPGLLLRDIGRGDDPQIAAVTEVIARAAPDILALQGIDWDYDGLTLNALAEVLQAAGADYPHRFAARPNTGMTTGLDLDGDGRLGEPEDAQGFGSFTGQGGLAVLSRYPILTEEVQDFSGLLWRDLPDALLPVRPDGTPFPSAEAQAALRLSTTAHWAVPIALPDGGRLVLLTFHATPPVFDGPEDRNGRRNHDEIRFWQLYLDGAFGPAPTQRFVIAGDANLDPFDSDGQQEAIRALLADPRLQDPMPRSAGAAMAADQGHAGPDAADTVDWDGPGRLRVDYVLPSADWTVAASGMVWPAPGAEGHEAALTASRHRLVWVDLRFD